MDNLRTHRLKQKDLVMNIFGFFSEEFERSDTESIWEIVLPLESIINFLREKCDVNYKSSHWVLTQLKRYEEDMGVKLFRKINTDKKKNDYSVALKYPFINFFQKQHLYVTEKIKVANAVFDKINNYSSMRNKKDPVKIFLGAGTLCYHLSTIFSQQTSDSNQKYQIHTNNLGALSQLMASTNNHENFIVSVPEGRADPVTHTIIGGNPEFYSSNEFDFIIQGTSRVFEGNLYIESHGERKRKQAILKNTSGQKILVLTKHEFSDKPIQDTEPYGNIRDYDVLIVPKKSTDSPVKKKYESIFEDWKENLVPEIINWNYEIYRVKK